MAQGLSVYEVPPRSTRSTGICLSVCETSHEQTEGRVNGQQIIILTKFVNKTKQEPLEKS